MIDAIISGLALWALFLPISIWSVSKIARTSIVTSPKSIKVKFTWRLSAKKSDQSNTGRNLMIRHLNLE